MSDKFNVKMTVVLSEIPVKVDVDVDKVIWLNGGELERSIALQIALHEKYPTAMEVAENNNERYQRVSYIDPETIKVYDDGFLL
jgi:hypothetical protein